MDTTTSPRARPGASRGAEALVLLAVAVVIAAAGAPIGLLWSALSSRVWMQMTAQGAMYDPETEAFAGADVRFALITAGAGLVAAIVCWLVLRRYRGPVMLVALVLGSAGSAWLAGRVGSTVGLSDYRYLIDHAGIGWTFPMPIELGAGGALASQALLAVLTYTVLAGCSRYPALRARRSGRVPAAHPVVSPLVEPVRLPLSGATPPPPEFPPTVAPPVPDTTLPGVAWPQAQPGQLPGPAGHPTLPVAGGPPSAGPPSPGPHPAPPSAEPPPGSPASGAEGVAGPPPAPGPQAVPGPEASSGPRRTGPLPMGPMDWPEAPDRYPG